MDAPRCCIIFFHRRYGSDFEHDELHELFVFWLGFNAFSFTALMRFGCRGSSPSLWNYTLIRCTLNIASMFLLYTFADDELQNLRKKVVDFEDEKKLYHAVLLSHGIPPVLNKQEVCWHIICSCNNVTWLVYNLVHHRCHLWPRPFQITNVGKRILSISKLL